MRLKGTLVEWNDARGSGFIEPVAGGERVFCHISKFAVRSRRPALGQCVTYELSRDERGRLRASQIRPPGVERRVEKEKLVALHVNLDKTAELRKETSTA